MAKNKRAQFGTVTDGEGASDRRANLETVETPDQVEVEQEAGPDHETEAEQAEAQPEVEDMEDSEDDQETEAEDEQETEAFPGAVRAAGLPAQEPNRKETTMSMINDMMEKFGQRKDDDVHKSFAINLIHLHMIKEIHERMVKRQPVHMSTGTMDVVGLIWSRLKKEGHF